MLSVKNKIVVGALGVIGLGALLYYKYRGDGFDESEDF